MDLCMGDMDMDPSNNLLIIEGGLNGNPVIVDLTDDDDPIVIDLAGDDPVVVDLAGDDRGVIDLVFEAEVIDLSDELDDLKTLTAQPTKEE
jgi:hypothetical protein